MISRKPFSAVVFLLTFSFLRLGADGYGRIGHWMTGNIAEQLLTPDAEAYVRDMLPQYNGSLAQAALWADEIKSHIHWADQLHYINPTKECKLTLGRKDCANDQCIVSAIFNYTSRLLDPTRTHPEKEEAIKFLIHFIGDAHQPLHASGKLEGGTKKRVRFGGKEMSLHEVWDYALFEHRLKTHHSSSRDLYTAYLLATLTTPPTPLPTWATCTTPKPSPYSVHLGYAPLIPPSFPVCPEDWIKDAAKISCKVVWPDLDKYKGDLSGEYLDAVIMEAEKGMLQAGVRIAWVINAVAAMEREMRGEIVVDETANKGWSMWKRIRTLLVGNSDEELQVWEDWGSVTKIYHTTW